MIDKKTRLLNLFSDDVEYTYHLVKKDDIKGYFVYASEKKDEYSLDEFEFTSGSVCEATLKKVLKKVERIAPSVFYVKKKNEEKLKKSINTEMVEDSNFSSFIEDIKEKYFQYKIADFIIYKMDPEAYEKKKEEEEKAKKEQMVEDYIKQVEEEQKARESYLNGFKNNIKKLLKEYFKKIILTEGVFTDVRTNLIKVFMANLDESSWPKVSDTDYVQYDHFNVLEIQKEYIKVCSSGRFQKPVIMKIKLDKHLFSCYDVETVKKIDNGITLYDFILSLYDVKEEKLSKKYGKEWEFVYGSEKLKLLVEKMAKKFQKEHDKDMEKRKEAYLKMQEENTKVSETEENEKDK